MHKTTLAIAVAAIALVSASPALAGGGTPSAPPASSPTNVPEPTDAVLLLMGAAGVVIGRRLHARKKQS
jgi:hypothetical protein